jgi:hypothetical protein
VEVRYDHQDMAEITCVATAWAKDRTRCCNNNFRLDPCTAKIDNAGFIEDIAGFAPDSYRKSSILGTAKNLQFLRRCWIHAENRFHHKASDKSGG